MGVAVWHSGKKQNGDILVRLINDEYDGVISWIDVARVDERGKKIGGSYLFFDPDNGKILRSKDLTTIDEHDTALELPKRDMPYFKIWHNKHKARYRLRLETYISIGEQKQNRVAVKCVDTKGKDVYCGNLLFLSQNGDKIHIMHAGSVFGSESQEPLIGEDNSVKVGVL